MRPNSSPAPARGPTHAASAAPPEEAKPAAAGSDAGRRGRVDSSGRRSSAVQTLLGALARTMFDGEDVTDYTATSSQGRTEDATDPEPHAALPRAAGVVQPAVRPKRTARKPIKSTAESTRDASAGAPSRDPWSVDVTGVQGPWSIEQDDPKIGAAGRVGRVRAARGRVERAGFGSNLMRPGVWGALLAAVAALVLLTVAGGFDLGDSTAEQNNSSAKGARPAAAAER